MIVTTPEYINALEAGEKANVRITFINSNVVFVDEDVDSSGIYFTTNMVDGDTLRFGMAYSTEIIVPLINSSKMTGLNLYGEFKIEFGVNTINGIEWAMFGYFKAKSVELDKTTDVYTIYAYDRMLRFDKNIRDFIEVHQGTNYRMDEWWDLLCEYVGISTDGYGASSIGGILSPDDFETGRNLLSKIADATDLTYARIDTFGNIELLPFPFIPSRSLAITDDDCYSIVENDIYIANLTNRKWKDLENLKWNEIQNTQYSEMYNPNYSYYYSGIQYIKNDGTIILFPDVNDYEYDPDNFHEDMLYTIESNPFFEQWSNDDIHTRLGEMYFGITTYRQFTLKKTMNVSASDKFVVLEAGDALLQYDNDLTPIYMPIVSRQVHWNGAFTCEFSTPMRLN